MRRGGTARCKGEGNIGMASVWGRERWLKGGRERKRDREGESESGWLARRTRRCTTLSEKVRSRVRRSSWTCSRLSKDVRPESSFHGTMVVRRGMISKPWRIESKDGIKMENRRALCGHRLKGDGSEKNCHERIV